MKIIDGHCDVLSKMLINPQIDFTGGASLDVTLTKMKAANMMMQSFAIYLPEQLKHPSFEHILQSIDLFYAQVLSKDEMFFVRSKDDLEQVRHNGKIGAFLTLEGAEGLMGNFTYLRIMFHLGVRSLGITWNYANWAADGAMEPRQGGLTIKGKRLVRECNLLGIILDVSHLSEKGFWELVDVTEKPFIASHSNVYELCSHPRNLKNDQINAIIQMNGRIGLTFVPWFICRENPVSIAQLLHHIDQICSLGGVKHIGFGSDFDGIDQYIVGLEHTGHYENLINLLLKHYKDEEVNAFLWKNWYDFYRNQLPDE